MTSVQLLDSLHAAIPVPSTTGSRGAALSMAIHCILAQAGYVLTGPGHVPAPMHSTAAQSTMTYLRPPSGWQAAGPDEWNFEYVLPCKASPFKLTVAWHKESGRVFVHAYEEGNPNNIQVLGLQMQIYIPDEHAFVAGKPWTEVMNNVDQLTQHVTQHICQPLQHLACPGVPPAVVGGKAHRASSGWLSPDRVIAAAQGWVPDAYTTGLVLTGVLIACSVTWWWSSRRASH